MQKDSHKHSKKKILIIEDEVPMAKAIELKLQKSGYEVITVFNGEEGIKMLGSHTYDLILLDLMMPGLDGWAVLTKITSLGIKTKVIITSNLSQAEDKKKSLEMGAVDFLVKSNTTLAEMVEEVERYL